MISYEEHKDFLAREAGLWDAELAGCLDAAIYQHPQPRYASDKFQRRYLKGFTDSKAKLDIQQVPA